jgi:hypothetical protein
MAKTDEWAAFLSGNYQGRMRSPGGDWEDWIGSVKLVFSAAGEGCLSITIARCTVRPGRETPASSAPSTSGGQPKKPTTASREGSLQPQPSRCSICTWPANGESARPGRGNPGAGGRSTLRPPDNGLTQLVSDGRGRRGSCRHRRERSQIHRPGSCRPNGSSHRY